MKRAIPKALLTTLLLFTVIGVAFAQGGPPSIDVAITPQISTTEGVVPAPPSLQSNTWFYVYPINDGDSISDTLPIRICTTSHPNNDGETGYPLTLHFGPQGVGGNLDGVTLPTDPVFNADGCQVLNITLDTLPLATGNYNQIIVISKQTSTPHNTQVDLNDNVIHIQVQVREATSNISCFITDSSGNFLTDCASALVTQGADGRFAIVTNKKNYEVATNPGQFYYNVLWTNTTGSEQLAKVQFFRPNAGTATAPQQAIPHGAQAIHGLSFPPPFSGATQANFDAVNDGMPSGADDKLDSIRVPAGWTLWANYHLEWAGVGKLAPAGIATTCETANQKLDVSATVSPVSGTPFGSETCLAGARGHKK